ncbi:MAG: AAA family ATPase [Chlorobiaceae bacterium]|nr:AAA family ATPase [Chlorobiaceae bacterium]
MSMNSREHLIIIKGKDLTDRILLIVRKPGLMVVTFSTGKSYSYAEDNVEWLSNPSRIPVDNCRVSAGGDLFFDVEDVLHFNNWVKFFRRNGDSRCCRYSEFSVQRMISSDGRNTDVLAYFRELAETSGLRTDDDKSMIAMKYQHLDYVSGRSILSGFLQGRSPVSEMVSSDLIFPFGCNMSQKMAVQRAMQHRLSLVQGPPGTGKTQTILNLIVNILLLGKRVAVVSNNNSATANVLEKLKKYELDFVAAFLGSNQNKQEFIEGQSAEAVHMPTLQADEEASMFKEILLLNKELDDAFVNKNELAEIIQQIDALRLEMVHFEVFCRERTGGDLNVTDRPFQTGLSARKLLHAWVVTEKDAKRSARASSQRVGFLEKISLLFRFGIAGKTLFEFGAEERIFLLQKAYYKRKLDDMESKRKKLAVSLEGFRFDERLERLTELSMKLLKHRLAESCNNRKRRIFELEDLSKHPEKFLNEYPVILSTTFSIITSLKAGYQFDCVIVDEASQVDLLSGVLAMSCAEKLVIVGDPMQLPNVLSEEDEKRAKKVALQYNLPEHARFDRHSLLSAVRTAFPEIPETLLREHYRCHPKIIQFCNQKFYGGELLVMTNDQGEPDVLKAYMTVEGQHARGAVNQRQIDEITQHILPELGSFKPADIGIVSPFRAQTDRMQASMGSEAIEIDTVHKYQGREKRVIIIATVSNEANAFVDNPNLLNVAVSRAQEKLRLVVSREMAEGNGNVADLVRYIRYNNCEVVPGRVRSIFDLLYSDYTAVRLKVLKKRRRISKFDSENLVYSEIETVLQESAYRGLGVVFQVPLSMLVRGIGNLTADESAYVSHPWTKTDFVVYRKVDKSPVLVIEVDGYAFHREGTRQAERDILKDAVLSKCGLPLLRLSTIGSDERSRIKNKLDNLLGY